MDIRQKEYALWLKSIKEKIRRAQIKASLAASRELIRFYWGLGQEIYEKQHRSQWGSSFINTLGKDLQSEFPGMSGFSAKNLRYCRAFYRFYAEKVIWQQPVAKLENGSETAVVPPAGADTPLSFEELTGQHPVDQIPWGHNIFIFTKSETLEEARFYIAQTIENGWSRDVLALQIKGRLFERQGAAVTNFKSTLPSPQSDLAQQTLKDPFNFDFLTLTQPYNERDIEDQLTTHITKFLLELGKGFAFIGRQYHLEVGDSDYYLDLLFYHIKLRCYVVVELKNTKFIPEYAGKLNFYLSAVDSLLKSEAENPTIGIMLCRDKNRVETEFALRDLNKPMGVSDFDFTEAVPEELKGSLPTVEEIEADLEKHEVIK
jgi:predicted nuclease of restriction endonuclease-like (RecB) superfamily